VPLPGDITLIEVTGSFPRFGNVPVGGEVLFTPSSVITDLAGDVILTQQPVTGFITPAGVMTPVSLPCTDNGTLIPAGWTWAVTEKVPGSGRTYSILLPHTLGPTVDLSDLGPVVPVTEMAGYLPLSGGTMTGPLALAADPVTGLQAATKRYADARTADKNYTQPFTSASTVNVTHGLGKYPAVTVTDTAGDVVVGDVLYTSLSALTVSFSAPFSGTVICN
jgi:hypothetical protein